MSEHIIDFLTLNGSHTRSIALKRDLNDHRVIRNYLITPNSASALRQISEGLIPGHTQRSWKVVGPYGSGKSALGVVLAQLMAGARCYPETNEALRAVSPEIAERYASSHRLTLPVIGSRSSFGSALAAAITECLQNKRKTKALVAFLSKLDTTACLYKGQPINAVAGDLAADFAALIASSGDQGVLLLIDEVGKFVEYAALNPEQGDLIALQQVAELACKPNNDQLMVVVMQHQQFASYAAGVGQALNDEWHKIAARFEEVPFDEPIERYAHFAEHALGVKPSLFKSKSLSSECRARYAQAIKFGVLRPASEADKSLFDHSERLYPLHPLTLAALAIVSKRFGQSERSFHAFLNGAEPKGLRDFAEQNVPGAWYEIVELYDLLADGHGLRFRELAAERRWAFANTVVDRTSDDPLARRILKTIAILELVQSGLNVPATAELVSFALGKDDSAEISGALKRLVDHGIILKRRKHDEYSLAVSDAVNVEALYERAAAGDENELVVSGITKALSKRVIVANRHYDTTGTIRTLGILVGTLDSWPQIATGKSDTPLPDGWLKLVLVTQGSAAEAQLPQRLREELDPLSITAGLVLSNEGRAALAEFAIWQTILQEVSSKQLDPWTTRYVESRLQEAGERVENLVISALMPTSESTGPTYWHAGAAVPDSEHMNISQLASWLFDAVYPKTPHIVNELINKDKPAAAINLARQRLFDFILAGDTTKSICGDSEFPPERLMHTTLLRHTGIWQEAGGEWALGNPLPTAGNDISSVWEVIGAQLRVEEPKQFGQVLEALAAPPLGVRAGPAGIWTALYVLINRTRCAVFERGSLVLELTSEHLQRMFKNPRVFTLRELPVVEESSRILTEYRVALSAIGCAVAAESTYLETARVLILWYHRLPDFTKQTLRISKDAALVRSLLSKATDPIELLTQTLPQVHFDSKSKEKFGPWLSSTLTNLGMAYRKLQEKIETALGHGFGISGPLSSIRSQLQVECANEMSKPADARLKSFVIRCADLTHSDEKWLDSIATLIVQRPLDSWNDDTADRFLEELTELCGHYQRWMKVVLLRDEVPSADNRYIGVTLTKAGGEETSLFSTTNEASNAIALDLLASVTSAAKGDTKLAATALAQALLEIKTVEEKENERQQCHG
ncbi:MAG: hypothetical protein P8014_05275 [Acidihalobacter sp.]|uniref:hypothetical protein n=1 Tax=Acidihalobacter sp. TaxID=1872108 RepID=UPI00307E2C2B